MEFNVEHIRKQFPALDQTIGKYPLVYFDNGATAQKPQVVLDRIQQYYSFENSNVHRGVHHLSQKATDYFEASRKTVADHIHARSTSEIVFTKGATDSINLLASSFCRTLSKGDEILITEMEHHSNIVPWQMMAEQYGLNVKYIPLTDSGELNLSQLDHLLTDKTRLLAITHISNSLGTVNPIQEIIQKAHENQTLVMVDGAQSLQHMPVNVQELDCDFLVFSGHKIFGPTGIGVLYGKEDLLDKLPPYQGGGAMISKVTMEKTTYNGLPEKFEAGTPHIAGVIGLGAALDWLGEQDMKGIASHEAELLNYASRELTNIKDVRIYGEAGNKSGILSFLIDGLHPFDIGTLLNQQGIAVRTGHHCTQPVMDFFGIPGTIRASFSFYNTKEEIDLFIQALNKAVNMLR